MQADLSFVITNPRNRSKVLNEKGVSKLHLLSSKTAENWLNESSSDLDEGASANR